MPLHESITPLDDALEICNEVEDRTGFVLTEYRQHDARLRASIAEEKARKEADVSTVEGDEEEVDYEEGSDVEKDEEEDPDAMDVDKGEAIKSAPTTVEEREQVRQFFLSGRALVWLLHLVRQRLLTACSASLAAARHGIARATKAGASEVRKRSTIRGVEGTGNRGCRGDDGSGVEFRPRAELSRGSGQGATGERSRRCRVQAAEPRRI